MKAAVAALTSKPVRFVLNTHWHGDHTGGNKDLGESGTLIVAHENVRKRMSTDQFIEAFGGHVEHGGAAQRRRRARGVSGGVANAHLAMRECPP